MKELCRIITNNMCEGIIIVVPVYNAQKTIKSCIDSVLQQSFHDWHLILVDDGSSDDSGRICDGYSGKDPRIVSIHQENKGSYGARDTGIKYAKSIGDEYITFLDSDDRLPENALSTYIARNSAYHADIVCGQMKRFWKNLYIKENFVPECFQIQSPRYYNHEEFISDLSLSYYGISNYPVSLWGKLFRQTLFNDSESSGITKFMGDDLLRSLPLSMSANSVLIINDAVYYYRIGGGTSKYYPEFMNDFIALYNCKKPLIEKYNIPSKAYLYMDIEIINCLKSYLLTCKESGKMSDIELLGEMDEYINHPVIVNAAKTVAEHYDNVTAKCIINKNTEELLAIISSIHKHNRLKNIAKRILYSI